MIGVPAMSILALSLGIDHGHHHRSPQALTVRGADISFLVQEEAAGRTFSRNGTTKPLETILKDVGATHARLRIWVDPPDGHNNLVNTLLLAHRVHAAGLRILLDIHYSDSWADHTTQSQPAAWAGQSLSDLVETVRGYTAELITRFAAQGTPVDIVQIGNEITYGMLWPIGFLDGSDQSWDQLGQLVNAGIDGARAGNPRGNDLRVALHISTGGDQAASHTFFDKITPAGGVRDFEVIAVSYYPWWNGGLGDVAANLTSLADDFDRDVLVVETAYPWTLEDPEPGTNYVQTADQLPQQTRYPPTPAGQRDYFVGLRKVLREIPGGRGLGFVDWEPDWLFGVPAQEGGSDPYSNLTMFDSTGAALPSIDVAFRRPT